MCEENRCTGHCCCGFGLFGADSPDEGWAPADVAAWHSSDNSDQRFFAANAIPYLGPLRAEYGFWAYTCTQFNGRDCLVYDDRPQLCRRYGEAKPCMFAGCTLKPAQPAIDEPVMLTVVDSEAT